GEEDQGLRISEEERIQEEEDADELYLLENLPTLDSVFRFEDRVKSLEVNFSEFMQTNQFAEAVSKILDKSILESYGDTAVLKRRRGDDDDQEGLSAGSDRGSKRRREDQPIVQTSQHPKWFSQPRKPPTPDRDWNKTFPAIQGSAQTWISELAKQADSHSSFNELLDTPIDFS
nr:hypothetical protein [Tanacetum cinerariifolium]